MDPSSRQAEADDHPHPKLIDFFSICLALLTLVFPISTVFRYTAPQPGDRAEAFQSRPRIVQLR